MLKRYSPQHMLLGKLHSYISKNKNKTKLVNSLTPYQKKKTQKTKTLVPVSSVTQLCLTLCGPMDSTMPGFPVHQQVPELTQTYVHRVGDAIQPSHPLSSPAPPAISLSQHQNLEGVSSLHQVAKVLEFQLHHQSFNEYSVLISFRIDWFDLLAVQGTLKSLLPTPQFKSINSLLSYGRLNCCRLKGRDKGSVSHHHDAF